MIAEILKVLIPAAILFEVIEHVVFPVAWAVAARRKKSPCGVESMPGKTVEVKEWLKTSGRVFVEGELWRAEAPEPLQPGDRAVVQTVDGLVLKILPAGSESPPDSIEITLKREQDHS